MDILFDLPPQQYTLPRLVRHQARRLPGKTLLWFEGRGFSHGEADSLSDGLAAGLQTLRIAQGTHVAVLMGNHPEMVWTLIALAKLGAVAVLINTAARGEMLRYFVEHSDSRVLIADADLAERVQQALCTLQSPPRLICNGELPSNIAQDAVQLGDLFLDMQPVIEREPAFNDVQVMMYTSGTTGPSKGVLCTYAQCAAAGRDIVLSMGYRASDVLFTSLPLFHANALRATMTASLWLGAGFALSRRFSARSFWSEICDSGATQFNALGAMMSILLKNEPTPEERNHGLRLCCFVPSMPPAETAALEERFHVRATSMYGSTEIGCPLYAGLETPNAKWPTCGRVLPSYEVRIADDDGFELAPGLTGELLVRPLEPGSAFAGYYKMPEATVRANRNFWFHTGDRCYRDKDGFFYFVDRNKESIRRRGENVSSFEVETIIAKLNWVKEAAVVPVPSPLGEDDILAFVVRQPGADAGEEDLIRYCQASMSYFMVPRYVTFIDALPRNSSEKVEKYRLQEIASDALSTCWDRERAGIALTR